jgi:hypothetical protein
MRLAVTVVNHRIYGGLWNPFPRLKLAVVRHRGSSRWYHRSFLDERFTRTTFPLVQQPCLTS